MLQPYQMVKDLRTGVETGNPGAVLDGDLDRFLEASLAQRIKPRTRWRMRRGKSRGALFFLVMPAKAGIQGNRSSLALDSRFRGMTMEK